MLGRPSAFLSVSCIEIVDHTAVQDVAVSTHDNRLRSHFRLSDSANLLVLIKDSGQIDLVLADMVLNSLQLQIRAAVNQEELDLLPPL